MDLKLKFLSGEEKQVADKRKKIMKQVVENLRGDALNVAIDVGIQKLIVPDGGEQLNKAMLKHISPVARHEAKHLYKEDHKTKEGVFVRQTGESMQSIE